MQLRAGGRPRPQLNTQVARRPGEVAGRETGLAAWTSPPASVTTMTILFPPLDVSGGKAHCARAYTMTQRPQCRHAWLSKCTSCGRHRLCPPARHYGAQSITSPICTEGEGLRVQPVCPALSSLLAETGFGGSVSHHKEAPAGEESLQHRSPCRVGSALPPGRKGEGGGRADHWHQGLNGTTSARGGIGHPPCAGSGRLALSPQRCGYVSACLWSRRRG